MAPFQCRGDCAADAQQWSFQQRMPSRGFQFETCLPKFFPAQKVVPQLQTAGFSRKVGLIFSSQLFPQKLPVFSIQFGIFKVSQGFSQHQKICQGKNQFRGLRFDSTRLKPTLGFSKAMDDTLGFFGKSHVWSV